MVNKNYGRTNRKHNSSKRIRIIFLMTALFFFLFITVFEIRLKPVVAAIAETQAKSMASGIINQSVNDVLEEMNISSEELDTTVRTSGGSITSIGSNTVLMNKIKSAVSLRIQENLSDVRSCEVDIPIGTIIGGDFLNGRGFNVPICISFSGNAESDFTGEFESGGLNQTVHKLSINVKAKLTIIMPLSSIDTEVCTSVPLSENVIVGSVPSGMLVDRN